VVGTYGIGVSRGLGSDSIGLNETEQRPSSSNQPRRTQVHIPLTLHLPEARAGHDDDAGGLHELEGVELVGGRLLRGGLGDEALREGDLLFGVLVF
jgi:hypothetical protein